MPTEMIRSVLCGITAMGTLVASTAFGLSGNGFACYSLLAASGVLLFAATYKAVPRIGK